jgi:hypothetical protein
MQTHTLKGGNYYDVELGSGAKTHKSNFAQRGLSNEMLRGERIHRYTDIVQTA